MTTKRGHDWGEPASARPDVVVASDRELALVVEAARQAGEDPPSVGLVGGDLCRTLGGTGDRDRVFSDEASAVPIDVGRVELDGVRSWFVAHCVIRRAFWAGPSIAVMNAAFIGSWNVAPRAHPNDGRLDVLEADLSWSDRWQARRRVLAGTHLPHPDITQRRTTAGEWTLDRPTAVWLDNQVVGRVTRVSVTIEPDSVRVIV